MSGSRNVWLTARDGRMLWFLAEHRMVLERQIAVHVGGSAESVRDRLARLEAADYLSRFTLYAQTRCCRIRPRGLAAIGRRLPAPEEKLGAYRHDAGVAWLWLAAHRGVFGPVADVVGERRIRSHDAMFPDEPYAVRLGGHDTHGRARRHYPDLLLISPSRDRLALELELSRKQMFRREEILAAYGADRRVDGVLYLVEDTSGGRAIGRALKASAAKLEISERVHVRPVTPIEADGRGRTRRPRSLARAARSAVPEAAR